MLTEAILTVDQFAGMQGGCKTSDLIKGNWSEGGLQFKLDWQQDIFLVNTHTLDVDNRNFSLTWSFSNPFII